jgi:hypothetical protein
MRDKDWKCVNCGKFVAYKTMDCGVPYGCSNYESPEPLPEQFWCDKCAKEEYKQALKDGVKMHNYWQKPKFQLKAMAKLGIVEEKFELILNLPPHTKYEK